MRSTSGESPAPGKVATTAGLVPKGVAPRAPSASVTSVTERPGGLSEGDVRTLAQAVAKDLMRPLETQLRSLEERLARIERNLDRTERNLESTDPAGVPAAVLPATPPLFPALAVAAPTPAPSEPKPAAVALAPASAPKAIEVRRPAPKLSLDDVHLSSEELGMFDAGKRKKRIAFVFVFVLLLAGGGLIAAMIVSRS